MKAFALSKKLLELESIFLKVSENWNSITCFDCSFIKFDGIDNIQDENYQEFTAPVHLGFDFSKKLKGKDFIAYNE